MYRDDNVKIIREEFGCLGLLDFSENEIAAKLKKDTGKFQVAGQMQFSQYGIKEDLNYEIFLKKTERQNLYHPYMFEATLKDQPEKTMLFRVSNDECFTIHDAFNLLNGRAVQKLVLDWSTRRMHNVWFQLDFDGRDVHGNFKLEQLRVTDQEYAVSVELSKHPIREMRNPEDRINLILSLLKGNAEPITLIKDGKERQAFVQASPKNRTVDVYTSFDGRLQKSKIEDTKKSRELSALVLNKARRKGRSP